jgi:hypothetical protein
MTDAPPPSSGTDPARVRLEPGAAGSPEAAAPKPKRTRKAKAPKEPTTVDAGLSDLIFGWTRHKSAGLWTLIFLGVLSAGLIVLDFFVDREPKFEIENVPGFYGYFGFVAFCFVVLSGWPLRRLLSRPADYYERSRTDD